MKEGKRRAEGEGRAGKRQRVKIQEMQEAGGVERWQNENRGLQLGAKVVEVLWHLNNCLVLVEEELAVSWEAAMENVWLLHHLLVHNLWKIKMTLEGQRGQEEGESEVGGSGEVEELEEWAEEQAEETCNKNEHIKK